jgi:hypothetical protein
LQEILAPIVASNNQMVASNNQMVASNNQMVASLASQESNSRNDIRALTEAINQLVTTVKNERNQVTGTLAIEMQGEGSSSSISSLTHASDDVSHREEQVNIEPVLQEEESDSASGIVPLTSPDSAVVSLTNATTFSSSKETDKSSGTSVLNEDE